MSCAWSLTGREPGTSCGVSHGLFTDSANVFLTASAVGIELPILSRGSGGRLNHLTNRAFPLLINLKLIANSQLVKWLACLGWLLQVGSSTFFCEHSENLHWYFL